MAMPITNSSWHSFDQGLSLGQRGSEHGIIVRDEEHADGARVTLERGGITAPFAITCGFYDWMVHTIFLPDETTAQHVFAEVKGELEKLLALMPHENEVNKDKYRNLSSAISDFVNRFQ